MTNSTQDGWLHAKLSTSHKMTDSTQDGWLHATLPTSHKMTNSTQHGWLHARLPTSHKIQDSTQNDRLHITPTTPHVWQPLFPKAPSDLLLCRNQRKHDRTWSHLGLRFLLEESKHRSTKSVKTEQIQNNILEKNVIIWQSYFCHLKCHKTIMKTLLEEKLKAKKERKEKWPQRSTWMDNINRWAGFIWLGT